MLNRVQLEDAIELLRSTIRSSRANRELKAAMELEPILAQREAELKALS
jgi:hypothetical protein